MYLSLHDVKKVIIQPAPDKAKDSFSRQLRIYTKEGVLNLTLFSDNADTLSVDTVDCVATHCMGDAA